MIHKRERFTEKERVAKNAFITQLDIKKRKTKKPLVVALVGLVGSGKSTVVRELAHHLGATIIEGDAIRVELRKHGEQFEQARAIGEHATFEVINRGGNVVLDSDFVDVKKRASIREKARKAGVHLVFVRIFCDLDVMVGRILTAPYHNHVDDFFGGAKSPWRGNEQSKGAVVKVREMWRRTPHHYQWKNRDGGQWVLKKFPFTVFAEIDTTHQNVWVEKIKRCAYQLLHE